MNEEQFSEALEEIIYIHGDSDTEEKVKQPNDSQEVQNDQQVPSLPLELIEFRFSQGARGVHMRNALLPYLAAGFTVIPTSGQRNQCGYRALASSLQAARELFRAPGEQILHLHSRDLERWITDQHDLGHSYWLRACRAWFRQNAKTLGPELAEQQLVLYNEGTELDVGGIAILLDAVNEYLDTNYSLGYVTDGFRGRIIKSEPLEVDMRYPQHTTPQIASDINDSADPRPIIWIRNDSASSKAALRKDYNVINHWCGFAPRSHTPGDPYHRKLSTAWDLDEAAELDAAEGVWVVHTPCSGGPGMLKLYKGVFVRRANVPEGFVSGNGYMFMVTPDTSRTGLVPIANLTRIIPPTPNDSRKTSVATTPALAAEESTEPFLEFQWTVEEPEMIADHPKPAIKKPMAKKQPRMTVERPKLTLEGPLNFEIFRTIPATNKVGGLYQHDGKKFIDGFTYDDGDFLLQHVDYPRNSSMINIAGEVGHVKTRTLQHLRAPWGLPNRLPGLPASLPSQSMANTVVQLKAAAVGRGLLTTGLKKDILARITLFDEDNAVDAVPDSMTQLPMYRILTDLPASVGPLKMPPFLEMEVVLKFDDGNADDGRAFVKDYEGRTGRIDDADLDMIERAWGIIVDAAELRTILDGMHKTKRKRGDDEDVEEATEEAPKVVKKVAPTKKKTRRRNW